LALQFFDFVPMKAIPEPHSSTKFDIYSYITFPGSIPL